jgi:putative phosphoesterase
MRIGLISDTHGYLDEAVFRHFEQCDEIWHAGDFGMVSIAESLAAFRPLKAVYGNIDGHDVRSSIPETLAWHCEGVKVLMTHIGGYPPAYNKNAKALLDVHKPQLFICGHSHILKIMYDDNRNCLHMNPGAAGRQGWHAVRTLIRFTISGTDIRDCEVIELGAK